MERKRWREFRHRRRGAVVVQVAVMSTVIMGFGALAIDVGMLYTAKAELQVAADSAALAAAAEFANDATLDPAQLARIAAKEFADKHSVVGKTIDLDLYADVELGHAMFNENTGRFDFQPGGDNYDAVRVTVRRTADSAGGTIPLIFGNVLGFSDAALSAQAAAVLIPRDIAVVIDLSNSMCYDSTLMDDRVNRSDGGYSNLRDVWCALDGPEPSRPYVPATALNVDDTEYQYDTGPTYGVMSDFGDPLIPGNYDKNGDPGLWYIPKNYNCTESAAYSSLYARGYSAQEVTALTRGNNDSSYSPQHRNRVGVIMGLAEWHSGKSGGLYPTGGNGNDLVGDSELIWISLPDYALTWNWVSYIDAQRSGYRYYYGAKTFTDFMMNSYPEARYTSGLWKTPQQPLRAVKDALNAMVEEIKDLDGLDQMSLEVFGGPAVHEVDLTENLDEIPEVIYHRQTGHYDRYTNIGGGLYLGISELLYGQKARSAAAKVIVIMSDGYPNRWDDADDLPYLDDMDDPDEPAQWSDGQSYARAMAKLATHHGIRVYAISVGYDVDRSLLQWIAAKTGGIEYYAAGDPEEYTAQLQQIFRTLGGKRPVALIE